MLNGTSPMVADSWYRGSVSVSLKEAGFEPSSPFRHAAELSCLLKDNPKPCLFIYSDGWPDHCLTYTSVQISLVALSRSLNLDYLCACRTAPCQSWKNPVERLMSTVNMGMQCVDLMRKEGSEVYEAQVGQCNSLADMRKACKAFQFQGGHLGLDFSSENSLIRPTSTSKAQG